MKKILKFILDIIEIVVVPCFLIYFGIWTIMNYDVFIGIVLITVGWIGSMTALLFTERAEETEEISDDFVYMKTIHGFTAEDLEMEEIDNE